MLNKKFRLSIVVAALLLSTFTGCGEDNTKAPNIEQAEIESKNDTSKVKASVSRYSIDEGEDISFKIESNSNIVKYEWFDEDGKLLSNSAKFNRLFAKEGIYTTNLTVTDDNGKILKSTVIVKVNKASITSTTNSTNEAPIVLATASNQDTMDGENVYFKDLGSYDPDGSIAKYEWRDMDGILLSDTKELNRKLYYYPQYDFLKNGTTRFVKTLTVTDNKGKTASKSFEIIVNKRANQNQSPTANAGNDKTIIKGDSVTLSGSGADVDGTIASYEWKNGSTVLSTNDSFSKNDFTVGVHTLKLTVKDNNGAIGSDKVIITVNEQAVENQAPTANAAVNNISAPIGVAIVFNANTSSDSDGNIIAFEWKLGDTVLSTEESFSKSDFTVGTHTVVLKVTDNEGATATDSIEVTIKNPATDTTPPVITLIGEETINLTVGDTYIEPGATAVDNKDGDIPPTLVAVTGAVNAAVAGTYIVKYNFSDVAENAATEVTRTVIVTAAVIVDTTPPVITLSGATSVNLTVGGTYTDAGATASDNKDGVITANIVKTGTVDTAVAGTYTITYNVSDAAGNNATVVTRTVNVLAAVVVDTTPPVITLSGATSVNLTVGGTYTDAGATASDNKDGVITANIVKTGTVDTAVAGTYTITYNVSDAAGNNATAVTRTVNVSEILDSYANWVVAKGDSYSNLSLTLDSGNIAKILVNPTEQLDTNLTPGAAADSIYGKITGHTSGGGGFAIFQINLNYATGTKIMVRVYDTSGNILATSSEYSYTKGANLKFDDINF